MDVHKPKPWHGWREFLKELGTIVLGVSVALAAEQTVEWFHWHTQVRTAREVLAAELVTSIGNGTQRVAEFQCQEKRLEGIAEILDAATQSGTLPPMAPIQGAPFRSWPSGVWNSVLNSQVASHFPREQLAELGSIYQTIQQANADNSLEFATWASLSGMFGPGRRFDPALDTALHAALTHARVYNFSMTIIGGQIAKDAQALDLPYTEADRKRIAHVIAVARTCPESPATVPKHYGSMPAPAYQNVIRDWQKYPPYR
jgi:hypothetical protein